MPLRFLTPDGVHDQQQHAEAVRARRAGQGWRRPYQLGPWRVALVALMLVLTAYLLFAALIVELAGESAEALVMVAAAAVVVALGLRILRVGVWVSGDGLRLVSLLRTTTVEWDRVGAVRTAQQPVRWLAMPRTVQGQALVVRRADGSELPTLLTDHSPDFLRRPESFDIAADTIEGWATDLRRG